MQRGVRGYSNWSRKGGGKGGGKAGKSNGGGGDRQAAHRRGEEIARGQPVWNFAFGANVNPWKLEQSRGIKPLESARGKMPGWRLLFNHRGGFGSIEEGISAGGRCPDAVHGMLLQLKAQDFATLCSMEHQYDPVDVQVEAYDGQVISARAFITMPEFRTRADNLAPTERYINLIREGAAQSGLDRDYVAWLNSLPSVRDRGPEYYEVMGPGAAARRMSAVVGAVPGETAAAPAQPAQDQPKESRKVDAEGVYQPFPGVTVVCHSPGSDRGPLAGLPAALKALPTLGSLYAPLPSQGYHVTTLDVCTRFELGLDDDPAAWEAVLAEPRWTSAATALEEARAQPELRVKKLLLLFNRLRVELEPASAGTCDHPKDLAVNARLVEVLGMERSMEHPWHFTLAYCTDLVGQAAACPEALERDRAALEVAVKQAVPGVLPLEEAKLCRFEDMTAFVPWDGGGLLL